MITVVVIGGLLHLGHTPALSPLALTREDNQFIYTLISRRMMSDSDSSESELPILSDPLPRRPPFIKKQFKKLNPKSTESPSNDTVDQSSKDCYRSCENLCMFKIKCFSDDDFAKLTSVKKSSNLETKSNLLRYLQAQDFILAENMNGFVFGGHQFCLKAFSKLTNVSIFLLKQVIDAYNRGVEFSFFRQKDSFPKLLPKTVNFIAWFHDFSKCFGQYAPDSQLITLPSFLTKRDIWKLYCEECQDSSLKISYAGAVKQIVKRFGVRRSDRNLPRVRFSRYSTHSVCDICSDLEVFQRSCKTQREIDFCLGKHFKDKC